MMNWIFGLPETVSAEISNMYSPKMPNDTAVLLFGPILQSYGDASRRLPSAD